MVNDKVPSSLEILKSGVHARGAVSSFFTLSLAIMGGAALLPSAAFQSTGIVAGFVGLILVALANAYTCDLLLWQTYKTGQSDFETLGNAVGGPLWRFLTELSIVVLMVGTIIGSIIQVGETFAAGLILVANPPGWLVNGSGRMLMVFATAVIFPLACLRDLSALDKVGMLGYALVLFMGIWIAIKCCIAGFPEIPSNFYVSGFQDMALVAQALSTFNYLFYIQPVMMPMLLEMPAPGLWGLKALSLGTRATVLGSSMLIYVLVGFFGAAWITPDQQTGNILQSTLGPKGIQAFLQFSVGVYLSLALPPLFWPLRSVFDYWLARCTRLLKMPSFYPKNELFRRIALNGLIVAICLGVALGVPTSSSTVLTITGASGVMFVSYLIPVLNHWILWLGWATCQRNGMPEQSAFWGDSVSDGTAAGDAAIKLDDTAKDPVPANKGHVAGIEFVEIKQGMMDRNARTYVEPKEYINNYRHDYGTGPWGTLQAITWDLIIPFLVVTVGCIASIATFVYI